MQDNGYTTSRSPKKGEAVLERVAHVDDQGQVCSPSDVDLRLERRPLRVAWGTVAKVVQPRLSDRDDAVGFSERLDVRCGPLVESRGVVGMAPHRGEHLGVSVRQLDRLPVGALIHPHREDSPDPTGARGADQLRRFRLAQAEMRVAVDHAVSLGGVPPDSAPPPAHSTFGKSDGSFVTR
jgi:hypothetical protein